MSTPADGKVEGTFTIANVSSKADGVEVSELTVTGRVPCLPLASDTKSCTPGTSFDIGPFKLKDNDPVQLTGNQSVDVLMEATGVAGERLRSLAANPRDITFRVTGVKLRRPGKSSTIFDQTGASIARSTAGITIDDGAGTVERWAVAAAIGRAWGRPEAAQSLPIALTDALDAIGVPYETAEGMDGTRCSRRSSRRRSRRRRARAGPSRVPGTSW